MSTSRKAMCALRGGIAALGILLIAGPVVAQRVDLSQPINIEADRAEVDYAANRSIYRGNVRLTQGSILVRAARVEIHRTKNDRLSADLSGQPAVYTQTLPNGQRVRAEANAIEYGAEAGVIELNGNAFIQRGEDTVRANSIRYDIGAGRTIATGGPDGRVRIRLTPPNSEQSSTDQ